MVGGIILLFCLVSIDSLKTGNYTDEWAFVYIGHHMDLDHAPYRDFADNKGIVTYFFYKGLDILFGDQFIFWRLTYLLIIIFSGLILQEMTENALSERASYFALATFLLLNLNPTLISFHAVETLGLFLILLSIKNAMSGDARIQFIGGAALGLGLQTHPILIPVVMVHVWLVLTGGVKLRKEYLVGLVLVAGLSLLLIASWSDLGAYYEFYIKFNLLRDNAGNASQNSILDTLMRSVLPVSFIIIAIIALSNDSKAQRWSNAFLILGIPAGMVFFTRPSIAHYTIPICPLIGFSIGVLHDNLSRVNEKRAGVVTILMILFVMMNLRGPLTNGSLPDDDHAIERIAQTGSIPYQLKRDIRPVS